MEPSLFTPAHKRGEMVAQARGQVMRNGLEEAAKQYGVDPRELDVFINVHAGHGSLTRLSPTIERWQTRKRKTPHGKA